MVTGRRVQVPAVELVLANVDAVHLSHILSMYQISARNGDYGTGTSVDADIKLVEAIREALKVAS